VPELKLTLFCDAGLLNCGVADSAAPAPVSCSCFALGEAEKAVDGFPAGARKIPVLKLNPPRPGDFTPGIEGRLNRSSDLFGSLGPGRGVVSEASSDSSSMAEDERAWFFESS